MQEILYKANVDIMLYNDNGRQVVNTDKVKNYIAGTPDSEGTMPLQNGFAQLMNAAPVSSSSSASSGGSSIGLIVGIVVAVVVVLGIGGFVGLRRRSTAAERE